MLIIYNLKNHSLLYYSHPMDSQVSPPELNIVVIDCPPTTINHQHNQNPKQYYSSKSILPKLQACHFKITLSLGSQALLWKTLQDHSTISPRVFPTLPSTTFHLLWYLTLITQITLSLLYFLKFVFHPQLVKSEFSSYINVNYLFTPTTSCLILLVSSPFFDPETASYQILCWVFAITLLTLDVKIYGQWFTSEKRFLSVFANPTSQVSVIGNFVGAWAAAEIGCREGAIGMFTLGLAHYLVVFVTLYQRLSGGFRIPARQRPVFLLFVAAPSVGSLAWKSISGTFDVACKMLFFLALFLFISLACRPLFFKKSMKRFSIAWWAYSFPVSFLALASAEYAKQVNGIAAPGLMLILSSLSVLIFLCIMVFTAFNAGLLLRENDTFTSSLGIKT